MKSLILTFICQTIAFSALAVTPLKEKYDHNDFPNVLGKDDVMLRVDTIQDFLDWVDLKAVYLNENNEGGSVAFFLAIPKVAGPNSTPTGGVADEKDKLDAIGYYFKSGVKQKLDAPYDNSHSAKAGSTGGTYTCFKDDKANFAEMDVLSFNSKAYNAATTPMDKLLALSQGLRFTPMSDGTGDIQVGCANGNLIPVFSPYPGDPVQTFAIFRNYNKGDEDSRKADGLGVYGPGFGGLFYWEKSQGKMTNADKLIQIYKDLGFE